MPLQVLIVGGGIGGLAAAIACARAQMGVGVREQADAFSEAGAGIQLGPNSVRVLQSWGIGSELEALAGHPARLSIRRARDDAELAAMPLGADMLRRYGAPYLTAHRADLQGMLLRAAKEAGADTRTGTRIARVDTHADAHVNTPVDGGDVGIRVIDGQGAATDAAALIVADGIWSALRGHVDGLDVSAAAPTGHVAFRALAPQRALPASCRSTEVTAWLGARMHVVAYPVRGGEWLNMVVLAERSPPADATDWDAAATRGELRDSIGQVASALRDRIDAMPAWRLWTLHDRPPLRSAQQMARGRIALLGDAAHPMLPYLAQGAGMAIEDACVLAQSLARAGRSADVPAALQDYARRRWQRCARVQQVARRNAVIFHARGPLAWGRDAALRTLGERLLDQPWLYGLGPAS